MRPLKEISETEMQDLVNKAGGENFSLKKPPVIIDTKKSPSADFFAGTVGRDIFKFGQRAGTFLLATNCQDQYERDCLTNCYSFILGDNYSFLFKEEFSFPFFQNFVFFWEIIPKKTTALRRSCGDVNSMDGCIRLRHCGNLPENSKMSIFSQIIILKSTSWKS